jgi:uncharacterized protein YrzB (UPF0473 family)
MSDNFDDEMIEEEVEVLVFRDGEGGEAEFVELDKFYYNGVKYIALEPFEKTANFEEGEVVFFQTDDSGDIMPIDNEEVYAAVYEHFIKLLQQEEDADSTDN